MNIEDANKIVNVWGKYLEYCSGRLNMLFLNSGGKIPESLLPYPKSTLNEALNIMDRHYYDTGNKQGMTLMRETMMLLELYGDDEQAIQHAGEVFVDAQKRKSIVSAIQDWQKTWITTQ